MNREELKNKVANNLDALFNNRHSFEDMAYSLIDLIQSNTPSDSQKIENLLRQLSEVMVNLCTLVEMGRGKFTADELNENLLKIQSSLKGDK